ncbi:hypothetical protein, partial [Yoonia sp. R2-816]|uniref:hypothetical protein n=1 Tax=Yoonia sp. R2-816 TaxID=3342638 RepID=UPI003728E67F
PLSSEPPLSTEKASIVGQVRQFTKCATSGKMRNISQKRQCRASGFVLRCIWTSPNCNGLFGSGFDFDFDFAIADVYPVFKLSTV